MKNEYRMLDVTVDSESRYVEGYALVFDSIGDPGFGFKEIISRNAVTQELVDSCDVFALFNHDRNKVLARSNKGKGSLELTIDDKGLRYRFEAPKTDLGDELLEHLRKGNIEKSSFGFCLQRSDKEAVTWENRNGEKVRIINKIVRLNDVSPVWTPAYDATECACRNKAEDYEDEIRELEDAVVEENTEIPEENDTNDSNSSNANDNDNVEGNGVEETSTEETNEENDTTVEETSTEETVDEHKNKNILKNTIMEKNFKLISAIRNIANNQDLEASERSFVEVGREEMSKSGLAYGGQIQIPVDEIRANVTVTAEGTDVVATDLYDIVGPLRAKNVLIQAGAKFLTGLVGNVQIPTMGAGNVTWEGETADAKDAGYTFDNVTLKPKRLTAYVNISKQMLNQTSGAVENAIRTDIINAINAKLEDTILADTAVSGVPNGIGVGKTSTKSVTTMAKIAAVESAVESANVYGETKWIVSPSFKATLRDKAKGSNVSESLYKNGEIDGTPALSTGHVGANLAYYGDWSQLVIGQFGAIDLTVDPYTEAKNGMITLIVNAWFDFTLVRPAAIELATTAAS